MKRSPDRDRLGLSEQLNLLLTNGIPRRAGTRLLGWVSRIRQPLVRDLSIALWRCYGDLDLRDARKARFDSVHDCFTRELREGTRPLDPDPAVLVSPCDAIVVACGPIQGDELIQAKGLDYRLDDLLGDATLAASLHGGCFATLRLTAGMYHRFHAPQDCSIDQVTHVPGDAFNVNPPAVKRIARLYCRNERAVIRCRLRDGAPLVLVPVAAVGVSGIRLHCAELHRRQRREGPRTIACNAALRRGQEIGWFEHGSTILVFAPRGHVLAGSVAAGTRIRMGQALMRQAAP